MTAIDTIRKAFSQSKNTFIGGFYNISVNLTPDSILDFSKLKISTFTHYYKAVIDKNKIQKELIKTEAIWNDSKKTSNLYGVPNLLPNACCVCNDISTEWSLFEYRIDTSVSRKGISFNYKIGEELMLNKACNALYNDRYWISVPFCKKHSLYDKSISVIYSFGIFKFTNKEYAIAFCKKWNTSLRYISITTGILRNLLLIVGAIAFIPLLCKGVDIIDISDGRVATFNISDFFVTVSTTFAALCFIFRSTVFKGKLIYCKALS